MRLTSKTGLLPTSRKTEKIEFRESAPLEMPKIVGPAPFTLKPFAGIYNPFPYACSVLCNHPADFEAKSVVRKAKDAWASEGRSLVDVEAASVLTARERTNQASEDFEAINERDDNIPEELFRKYTETDSRPLTPTPTLASVVTKNPRSRRCMTPDPTSFIPTREKTLLVLDLRRSHSQETVCWPASQAGDVHLDGSAKEEGFCRGTSITNAAQGKRKRNDRRKPTPSSARASSLKTQTSKDSDSKVHTQHSSVSQSPSKGSIIQEQEASEIRELSSESSFEGKSIVKRRGKKTKRGKKSGKEGGGEKEFQGIPDPGETQVSALESDSKEGSSRPSLTGEETRGETHEDETVNRWEVKPERKEEKEKSFLTEDTLTQLQRQLDQEVVDSELNVKRKMALEEALRLKKTPKHSQQGEEMKNLKKEFQLVIKDSEKWLSIPRVFTRRSARFELPMDSRTLNNMTPLQYVETYVFASPERLVLYNHVFNLLKEDPEDDEERERILLGENVVHALGKVMGRPLTEQESDEFRSFFKWKEKDRLSFRTFAGISATCERVMSPRFCSKISDQKADPRPEIERADFETLDEKLTRLKPDRNLVHLLKSIRDT